MTHTGRVTDAGIDQLQDELREMARDLRGEAQTMIEDDDVTANRDLSALIDEIANARPLLVRFAFLLSKHADKHSAIAELTNAGVAA